MAGHPRSRRHIVTYRSGLEERIADALTRWRVIFSFEEVTLPYVQPAKNRRYTPDFILSNGIVIESKGIFSADDRAKHLLIKEQYPDLELRFVFSNARARISKGAKTLHYQWAEKHGFKWAHKEVPKAWTEEPPFPKSLATLAKLRRKK